MKALLLRVKNVANDRVTRVLFYDQTLKKGYASLASFSKLFILRRALITLIAYPFSLACWVFLVLLNLITPVRIYRFKRPQRPGFASVYIEQLEPLCRELQATGHNGFLIFIDASQTTNLELLKLYATHFNLYLDDRVSYARSVFYLMPKFGFPNTVIDHSHYNSNWELPPAKNGNVNKSAAIPKTISVLNLKPLNYVVISYPSINYYLSRDSNIAAESNRFIDPTNSVDALNLLIKNGIEIVRVGVDTEPLPKALKTLPIIDLSGSYRTDSQDLWLFKHCLFAWAMGGVGTWHFAHKFDRPSLVTDSYAQHLGYQASQFSMQLIYDSNSDSILSLKEILSLKAILGRTQEMNSRGLSLIQNSPKQLCDAVEEILAFQNGDNNYSSNDLELLAKYDQISRGLGIPERKISYSRPCISFLRAHKNLLA
ncbi:unannotated protein [freshwater metagenome]|uniref:Unannotated protein n=1 Tax=freshwater metagenome TaxID=449393 RepID=A0A6J6MT32_9ZZZZ|nr:TIGR04372 family glycosyltransferase [Actinomycetota bacterium]